MKESDLFDSVLIAVHKWIGSQDMYIYIPQFNKSDCARHKFRRRSISTSICKVDIVSVMLKSEIKLFGRLNSLVCSNIASAISIPARKSVL